MEKKIENTNNIRIGHGYIDTLTLLIRMTCVCIGWSFGMICLLKSWSNRIMLTHKHTNTQRSGMNDSNDLISAKLLLLLYWWFVYLLYSLLYCYSCRMRYICMEIAMPVMNESMNMNGRPARSLTRIKASPLLRMTSIWCSEMKIPSLSFMFYHTLVLHRRLSVGLMARPRLAWADRTTKAARTTRAATAASVGTAKTTFSHPNQWNSVPCRVCNQK